MPSAFTHAVVGLGLGAYFAHGEASRRLLAAGALCAVLPDLDVIGLPLGWHLDHPLGHRGLSHSLPFAAALAGVIAWLWPSAGGPGPSRVRLWTYFFLATASHGALDAFTNGGRGVAFLAPLSDDRFHAAFRPIEVSPIRVAEFFTDRGVEILANELVWIWLPVLAAVTAVRYRRRAATRADRRRPATRGATAGRVPDMP